MALLNFANTYEEISGYLNTPPAFTGDYVKLFFSKDGHIISHGKDYTPTFAPNQRGLVPLSSGNPKEVFRADSTWAEITTQDLPIASSISDAVANNTTESTILNTKQVLEYVGSAFAANDAMRYKGTIEYKDGGYVTVTTGGVEIQGFPKKCEIGDTYRIKSQGTYADQKCSSGDLLICVTDGEGNTNSAEYWTAVEANIDGVVRHSVNGTSISVYSNSATTFNIFAPTSHGIQNQVLLSDGNSAPIWQYQNELKVGQANKVTHELSAGAGLTLGAQYSTFDGSEARVMSLLPASDQTIGGVIIDRDSQNKTISIDTDGNIHLTKQNVVNALGFDPSSLDTWRPITVGGISIGTDTLNFVPTGDIYLKADTNGDGVRDISFGLSWYNISEDTYEMDQL